MVRGGFAGDVKVRGTFVWSILLKYGKQLLPWNQEVSQ